MKQSRSLSDLFIPKLLLMLLGVGLNVSLLVHGARSAVPAANCKAPVAASMSLSAANRK